MFRHRPSVLLIAAVATAAVVLAGCSSSSKSTATTTAPTGGASSTTGSAGSSTTAMASTTTAVVSTANFNSCSVVTQAEAAAAIGQAVSPGVLGNATVEGGKACVFYGPSSPTTRTPDVAQTDTVRVVAVKGGSAMTWYNDFKSKVAAQPISGYGDQAFYDGRASLSVMKGSTYLRIAVVPAGAPPSLAAEEKLAAAILPKL